MRQLKITKQITKRETNSFNRYLSEISNLPDPLSNDEEIELARRIHGGDEAAVTELVERNLRFVISVAKQYQTTGASLEDLVNEGNIGLIKAAHRFDETRGFKFISYAVWWIRQSILSYLGEHSRIVRLPLNKITQLSKIKRESERLTQILERNPTPEELAEVEGFDFTKEGIRNILSIEPGASSFDAPLMGSDNKDEGQSLITVMINHDADKPDENLAKLDLNLKIKMLFKKISEREAYIVTHYFGLFGYESKTLDEIGKTLGLTRERVRQLKADAFKRLKRISRKSPDNIIDFLNV